ncbi:methyltransferase-like protein 17, mitochondrial isoform X1 [Varroa jacobsoni]|uniref:methyltransferase-like protein 17, mitochondrial isoform X1 n=1 Tax=Varroa jacobsoni TaxID=62625 RepID=UPI000BF2EE38|nr:methyltransferase-like protein 17, mitochondrial isoform X1 [Varroa jacobsoni]
MIAGLDVSRRVFRGTSRVLGGCRLSSINAAAVTEITASNVDDRKPEVYAGIEQFTREQQLLCRRKNPAFALPHNLQHLIRDVFLPDKNRRDRLLEGAKVLKNQLWSRRPPVEKKELKEKVMEIIEHNFGDELKNLSREERKMAIPQVKEVIIKDMRHHIYHWRPINYDAFGSYCYLLGRTPMEYAVLRKVFKEIKILDPKIEPRSCFDFGSGLGSVWWALKEQFPHSFKEYFSVEPSKHMRDFARYLAQGGPSGKQLPLNEYSQRAKLGADCSLTYDIVVSAFSLMELPNARERREAIELLWAKTKRHLVVIENGTSAGYKMVVEARAHVLELSKIFSVNNPQGAVFKGHVLAPCTHSFRCNRMHCELAPKPCSFEVRYMDLLDSNHKSHTSLYSYVVMTKVNPEALFEGPPCARIISPVLPRTKCVICRICTSKGEIKEQIFTKNKHGGQVYKTARSSNWGDLFLFENVPSASRGYSNASATLAQMTKLEEKKEQKITTEKKEEADHSDNYDFEETLKEAK